MHKEDRIIELLLEIKALLKKEPDDWATASDEDSGNQPPPPRTPDP